MPNKYLYDSNGIRRGMWTVSWYRDILGEGYAKLAKEQGMSPEEALGREAEKVPVGSDGLMTVLACKCRCTLPEGNYDRI